MPDEGHDLSVNKLSIKKDTFASIDIVYVGFSLVL